MPFKDLNLRTLNIDTKEVSIINEVKEDTTPLFFTRKDLYFQDTDKECKYDGRNSKSEKNSYFGQLKLFIELLSCMIFYCDEKIKKVVYVGAMEGTNIALVVQLYPDIHFDLYDIEQKGRKFDNELRKLEEKNVSIFNRYFDDKDIERYLRENKNPNILLPHKTDILFISDIRSIDVNTKEDTLENKRKTEIIVWSDMLLQQSWVEKLYPKVASLKFRLPYILIEDMDFVEKNGGMTRRYLDGVVTKQIFHRYTSSESRLIVRGIHYKDWDLKSYEEKNAYHNYYTRRRKYHNIFDNSLRGYDEENKYNHKFNYDCETSDGLFDSTYLMFIIKTYFESKKEECDEKKCMEFVDMVIKFLNKGKKTRLGKK